MSRADFIVDEDGVIRDNRQRSQEFEVPPPNVNSINPKIPDYSDPLAEKPPTVLGVILSLLLLVPLSLAGIGLTVLCDTLQWWNSDVTTGTVCEVADRISRSRTLHIAANTAIEYRVGKKAYLGELPKATNDGFGSSDGYAVGDTVTVQYSLADPTVSRIAVESRVGWSGIAGAMSCIALSIALPAVGCWAYFKFKDFVDPPSNRRFP